MGRWRTANTSCCTYIKVLSINRCKLWTSFYGMPKTNNYANYLPSFVFLQILRNGKVLLELCFPIIIGTVPLQSTVQKIQKTIHVQPLTASPNETVQMIELSQVYNDCSNLRMTPSYSQFILIFKVLIYFQRRQIMKSVISNRSLNQKNILLVIRITIIYLMRLVQFNR